MVDDQDDGTKLQAVLLDYIKNPDEYYAHRYAEARNGDQTAAIELLREFVAAVNTRQPVSRIILEYLAMAFGEYLGDPAKHLEDALLLTRPKHRPRGHPQDPVSAVAAMYLAMKRDGMSKSDAKLRVCDCRHIEQRTLENYDRDNALVRKWDVATLEMMARVPAPSAPHR